MTVGDGSMEIRYRPGTASARELRYSLEVSRFPASGPARTLGVAAAIWAMGFGAAAISGAWADGPPAPARWRPEEALSVLYAPGKVPTVADALSAAACPAGADPVPCLLEKRYGRDARARLLATELYATAGWIAGVERPHVMDGGWRGRIRIVPELPTAGHRKHLAWAKAAADDFALFFAGLERAATAPMAYRWRGLALRFFRSVDRTTPSAYAGGWEVAYNVSGSLHRSGTKVRRTLFHEIFHLNDADHDAWSERALRPIYDGIIAACGGADALEDECLAPFAPNGTRVRGSTYYAFHPGEGVEEYGAELAIRYYREHRAVVRGERLDRPAFKCGAPENTRAWRALADEFFGGLDLLPPCD